MERDTLEESVNIINLNKALSLQTPLRVQTEKYSQKAT